MNFRFRRSISDILSFQLSSSAVVMIKTLCIIAVLFSVTISLEIPHRKVRRGRTTRHQHGTPLCSHSTPDNGPPPIPDQGQGRFAFFLFFYFFLSNRVRMFFEFIHILIPYDEF